MEELGSSYPPSETAQSAGNNSTYPPYDQVKSKLAIALNCAVLLSAAVGCFGPKEDRETRSADFLDDKVTRARVEAALRQSSSNHFNHVQVAVTNGTVYLSGVVPNKQDQQQATQVAESVHRTKQVENQTQVAE
jgi:hypothetical protein